MAVVAHEKIDLAVHSAVAESRAQRRLLGSSSGTSRCPPTLRQSASSAILFVETSSKNPELIWFAVVAAETKQTTIAKSATGESAPAAGAHGGASAFIALTTMALIGMSGCSTQATPLAGARAKLMALSGKAWS